MVAVLSGDILPPEQGELFEREQRIERAMRNAFVEVGLELGAIQGRKHLYQAAGYKTFEDYCETRWELQRQRAYALIETARCAQRMSEISDISPSKESHVRALLDGLDSDEDRALVYRATVDEVGAGHVTAKAIERQIERHRAARAAPEALPPAPAPAVVAPAQVDLEEVIAAAPPPPEPIPFDEPTLAQPVGTVADCKEEPALDMYTEEHSPEAEAPIGQPHHTDLEQAIAASISSNANSQPSLPQQLHSGVEPQIVVTPAPVRPIPRTPDPTPEQRADHERLWRVLRALEHISEQDITPAQWLGELPDFMLVRFTSHLQKARPWLETLFNEWDKLQ